MSSVYPFHFKAIPKWAGGYKQGQRKVYFPTFPMRLVRPSPDQPRDIAIFHVPPRVNKLHIADYLLKLYGVKVNYIRTAIYVERLLRKEEREFEHVRLRHKYITSFAEHYAGRDDMWTTRYEDWMNKSDKRLNTIFRKWVKVPAYKKVVVTLAEPFMFPPKPDPMAFPHAKIKIEEAREEWDRRNPTLAALRMKKEQEEKANNPQSESKVPPTFVL